MSFNDCFHCVVLCKVKYQFSSRKYHQHTSDCYNLFYKLLKFMSLYGQNHPYSLVDMFYYSKGQRPVTFQTDASQPFSVIGQYFQQQGSLTSEKWQLVLQHPVPFCTLPPPLIWLCLCWLSISSSIYIYWSEQKSRCHDHGPPSSFSITSLRCSANESMCFLVCLFFCRWQTFRNFLGIQI